MEKNYFLPGIDSLFFIYDCQPINRIELENIHMIRLGAYIWVEYNFVKKSSSTITDIRFDGAKRWKRIMRSGKKVDGACST